MLAGVIRSSKTAWGRLWWLGLLLLFVGIVTNFGTAALRIPTLVPYPEAVDGASYYVGAWAMRHGVSPYVWTPEFLRLAGEEHSLPRLPTPPASPTPWVWMYQILTVFPYPVAAWIWLAIQLAVMTYGTYLLAQVAGRPGWKTALVLLPFTVTFGSTFLNLTIGQNGVVVFLGALLLGRYLGHAARRGWAVAAWALAAGAKIYPLFWIVLLPFLKRWRLAVAMLATVILLFGMVALLEPDADRDYWFNYLLKRSREVTGNVFVDDQSLSARVEILGRTYRAGRYGLDIGPKGGQVWAPPWEASDAVLKAVTVALIAGLGVILVRTWMIKDREPSGEGLLYLTVLFFLLPIPHMERYNHVAVLPAMAWLWQAGHRYRLLTVLAYCLVGLSRLNQLWAVIFAWPLGPLMTGTCMYAVLILGTGIVHRVRSLELAKRHSMV
jgi:hypothetical protein